MNRLHRRAVTGLIAGTAIAATAGLLSAAGTSAAASPGRRAHLTQASTLPKYVMWDVGSDFGITATNPQPDSYGNPGVWSWLQGSQLLSPSTFTLLQTYTNKLDNVTGFDGWQGTFAEPPPLAYLPLVAANASGAIIDGSTLGFPAHVFYPKNAIVVHPSPTSDAIIGWTSPVAMTVTVTTTLVKLDRGCGDGITWQLSDGGNKLTGGAIGRGGQPDGAVRTLAVSVGTTIYLEVGPGPNQGYGCDSTGVSLMITGHS